MQKWPGRGGRRHGDKKKDVKEDDGFAQWGGYMAAKRAKLLDQFHGGPLEKISDIFNGVEIMVNGLTHPSANELKDLMASHGGVYHMYQVSSTTHIIASNLPNVKIKHLGSIPIVKPSWITESIALGKLLDYRRYLLYNNQSTTQPALKFPVIPKPLQSTSTLISPCKTDTNLDRNTVNNTSYCIDNSSSNEDSYSTTNKLDFNMEKSTIVAEYPHSSNTVISNILMSDTANNTLNARTNTTRKEVLPVEYSRITKTASDPKFLEEFYNNSRLHLISTLGAEFKHLVGQLRDKCDGKFPGKERLFAEKGRHTRNMMTSPVVMHIDMDCFFVSVGLRNHPELKGKPVAITHARSGVISVNDPTRKASREKEFELYSERLPEGVPSRVVDIKDKIDGLASMSEIASCSYEARKFGIKNGMFLGTAIKLCPELKTLPYDFQGYKEVSNTLYRTIASYTLDIEAVSCDEMYVDVTKILRDTGLTVEEWATHIRNEIVTATGCPCSTGFGANRLQARLATRKAKPAGQYYLKADNVETYMSDIPLADLPGVGRATLAKLNNLGLTTCGDVQLASLKLLQTEIGQKAGETLKEQSFGNDTKPLNFHHERKSVSAEVNYGIRFKCKEEAYSFLESLSNEVFSRISDIGMRARCLTLKLLVRAPEAPVETAKFLGHGVCDALSKSTTSNSIINDPKTIFREAKMLYDKLTPVYSDLRGVGIQLTKLEKNVSINNALSNFLKQGSSSSKKNNEEGCGETVERTVKNIDVAETVVVGSNDVPDVRTDSKIAELENAGNTDVLGVKTSRRDVKVEVRSKRGRPKGGGNRSISKTNTLSKFLEKNQEKHRMENQNKVLPNIEVDFDVLNELPEEIRKEIMREYNVSPLKVPEKTRQSVPSTLTVADTNVTQKSVSKTRKGNINTNTQKNKSLFEGLSWDQIKPIIKSWISTEQEPNEFDVDMLAEHFKSMAIDRQIEVLKCIFNFLFRTFSSLNCAWHKAYFSMVNSLQQGMVARYGSTLLVDMKFQCCEI